ncbi:16S rRNA (guanine(527)-N(7))-methyltransferase RsmG [Paracoccus aestuariivivens]|uniref:Ribosomal RNA small subunit methyltransferase G n=1 Tax=Paracoccus aestuariivivens TaxID=1820333 RepID=A0A6L6JAY5_9RHOB|nr:16S rRNA (guanine(527)-N(7))-methyltransferase RsmG [Paracoccus aestuariivivens]MTH78288.1 16S rRNA (guanine(527)-N(7))-methyltransferase RsmG [Paracoccus aestuariivivens]
MIVSRETESLEKYAELIRKWNPAINLVATSTLRDLKNRHIADCQELARLAASADGKWVDLGSGGGLPGLIVAIFRPELSVGLLESDKRKSSFLRNAARELNLQNVIVYTDRIEKIAPLLANSISARALAPLPLLLSYVDRHLALGGKAWLMKGRNWQSEVQAARADWNFEVISHPSATDPDAAILEISELRHV